ncbi:MAG: cysteine synthase family protein [candidate division WOR-3 bacterium]
MEIRDSILECVGKTPLVALDRYAPPGKDRARVLAKMELLNPYSVKDRPALSMINEAEKRGQITPGKTTIIEATSGNTGIGLAMVCAVRGYRLILCMSEGMTEERKRILRALDAEIVLTPAEEHTAGARKKALELAAEIPDSYYIKQHDNPDNRLAHIQGTAEEIWSQTEGRIAAFVAGLGTCGTLTGVAKALKPRKPDLLVVGVEPAEAPYFRTGEFKPHGIPGVVPGFTPGLYDPEMVDEIVDVPTEEARKAVREISRKEGILVGISSGACAWAARQIAGGKEFAGSFVICIFADSGQRYLSVEGLW